jgi:hypothetical protein
MTSSNSDSQDGCSIPKHCLSFALLNTEFDGRRAGTGYSPVEIGFKRGPLPAVHARAWIACANPYQLVDPPAVM